MNKYLIVGLGNIGEEYVNTRHNIGFLVVDKLIEALGGQFKSSNFGQLCETSYKGRKIFILKPDTYMNLSGNAVKFWMNKENIKVENVIIVTDDLHLPFGTLRIKKKGSNGGHNGLKNIEEKLNTSVYTRMRFGVGSEFSKGQQIDFVLGEWSEEEKGNLETRINTFSDALKSIVFSGIDNTMNIYNGK